MSIQAVSNNNVSFGHIKTTKKGNEYKKSHFATRVGVLSGLAASAGLGCTIQKALSIPECKSFFKKVIVDVRNNGIANGMSKKFATKFAKLTLPMGFAAISTGFVLTGLIVGAGINKIVNHIKAHNADKSAAKQMTQTAETPKS